MARSEEIDALMMGHLYGELSESEEAAFQAKLAKDSELEAEVASFRRTREAFGQLPPEEPPASISAQLLHEAAKRAPAKKRAAVDEGPGFLERLRAWFQPIMAHPAAASVAALLLVAGVAGAFYMRGVDTQVHPTVRSDAPPPVHSEVAAATAAPAGGAPTDVTIGAPGYFSNADESGLDGAEDNGLRANNADPTMGGLAFGENSRADSFEARLAAPEQELALREQEKEAKERQVYRPAPSKLDENKDVRRKSISGKAGVRGEDVPMANAVSGADPLIVVEDGDGVEGSSRTIADGRVARGGGSAGSGAATTSEIAKAPPPADKSPAKPDTANTWDRVDGKKQKSRDSTSVARQAPARNEPMSQSAQPASDSDDSLGVADQEVSQVTGQNKSETYRVYKDKRSDEVAKSLHGKLNRTLDSKKAKKGRCQDAARIANDILDRNPSYYHAKVQDSKRIDACRWYVAEETRSRQARRARKASSKASQQAAPAEADSAESVE